MKTYLFNTENGLYAGEIFEDADKLTDDDGMTPVPPPEYEHGQVPVFDRQKNDWEVIPKSVVEQLLSIKTSLSTENQL